MRVLRKFWAQRITTVLLALPVAVVLSSSAAGSDDPRGFRAAGEFQRPSKFDYLVLASMADSQQLFTLARYRGSGGVCPAKGVDGMDRQKYPCSSTKYSRPCSVLSCGIPSFQRKPARICAN